MQHLAIRDGADFIIMMKTYFETISHCHFYRNDYNSPHFAFIVCTVI